MSNASQKMQLTNIKTTKENLKESDILMPRSHTADKYEIASARDRKSIV